METCSGYPVYGYLQAFVDDLIKLAKGSDTGHRSHLAAYAKKKHQQYREMVQHQRTMRPISVLEAATSLTQDLLVDLHNSGQCHTVLQRNSLGQTTRQ